MKPQLLRFDRWQSEFLRKLHDYLRYTFTPKFGLMMLVGFIAGFGIMAVLLYRFQPLVAVVIVCSYAVIFFLVMILSFLHWKRYRNFYKEVFKQ